MKRNKTLRAALSALCCAVLLAALAILPASAEDEMVLEDDFSSYEVGEDTFFNAENYAFYPSYHNKVDDDNYSTYDVAREGDNAYLHLVSHGSVRNFFNTKKKTAGPFTFTVDVRMGAAQSETATPSLNINPFNGSAFGNGSVLLYVDPKWGVRIVDEATGDSKKIFMEDAGGDRVLPDYDVWYTLKCQAEPGKMTYKLWRKGQSEPRMGNEIVWESPLLTEQVLANGCNIRFENLHRSEAGISTVVDLDELRVVSHGSFAAAGGAVMLNEDFDSITAPARYGGGELFTTSDIPGGGAVVRTVIANGTSNYLQMTAQNGDASSAAARNRLKSKGKFGGAYTLEWDYNAASASRFDVYLRAGGAIRVTMLEDSARYTLRVLDSAKVPGKMESAVSTASLKTGSWYAFKLTAGEETMTLEVWDKAANAALETLTIPQDNSTNAGLLDPTEIWLDLWGYSDPSKTDTASVAIDNLLLTTGAYEGMKNASKANGATAAVTGGGSSGAGETVDVVDHDCPAKAMIDVHVNAWYHAAVDWALTKGVMSGYNAWQFGPEDTLSRAMVVQVLYNKENKPATSDPNPFSDVPQTQWYYNAVRWGAAKSVVAGYGGGLFQPDDPVTVEQVAVILHNYSGKPAGKGDASALGEHSDWAEAALAWAAESGLLAGVPYDALTGPANRAQTAQMLMNYMK